MKTLLRIVLVFIAASPGLNEEFCSQAHFECNDGTCISRGRTCNGIRDCQGGEDESSEQANCISSTLCHERNETMARMNGYDCRGKCDRNGRCKAKNKKCICDDECGFSCINPWSSCLGIPPFVKNSTRHHGVRYERNSLADVPSRGMYRIGDTIKYECEEGMTLVGPSPRCTGKKQWSNEVPRCIDFSQCGKAGNVGNLRYRTSNIARVVNGQDAADAAWPWQALITRRRDTQLQSLGDRNIRGGGSLLNNHWVLTAAHVFSDETATKDQFVVSLGVFQRPDDNEKISKSVRTFDIGEYFSHPDFNGITFENDIALIKLGSRLDASMNAIGDVDEGVEHDIYIRPVCIPCTGTCLKQDQLVDADGISLLREEMTSEEKCSVEEKFLLKASSKVVVTGYGHINPTTQRATARTFRPPKRLQQGLLRIEEERICNESIANINLKEQKTLVFNGNHFCCSSGSAGVTVDSCQGDSGGPVVSEVNHSKTDESCWIQIGIVSFGLGCGRPDIPGYYTNLARYAHWVARTVEGRPEPAVCPEPSPPEYGSVDAGAAPWGYENRITYDCNVGYKLYGGSFATCDENGSWGEEPTCRVDPDCDFNSHASSTCGYESINSRWRRELELEPGSIQGYVIQASTAGATLVSPELPVQWTEGSICLRFYYKLQEYYSGKAAKLKVDSPRNSANIYWESHTDEEYDVWLDAVITFELNSPVQYQFVDVRGTVMMDEIEVREQECDQHCSIGTCQNGGTCVNRITSYSCFCARYFKGRQCQTDMRCPNPRSRIPNGQRGTLRYLPDDTVVYTCDTNHKFTRRRGIVKRVTVQCVWKGIGVGSQWDVDPNSLGCEEITCSEPLVGEHQELLNPQAVWRVGTTARYTCDQGYVFADSSYTTRRCGETGSWLKSVLPECILPYCVYYTSGTHPATPIESKERYSVRDTITLQCERGYILKGASRLTCRRHEEWSAEQPTCAGVPCGRPPTVMNAARNSWREYIYNDVHDYGGCNHGYYLEGSLTITCQYNRTWTRGPACREIKSCAEVVAPAHGSYRNTSDRIRIFSCERMYELKGEEELTCRIDGTWSSDPPSCKEKKPKKSMVFEGLEYLVYTDSVMTNFSNAQKMCFSIGGNLAVLYTHQVLKELTVKLSEFAAKRFGLYIGLVRRKIQRDPYTKFFDWVADNVSTTFPGTWDRRDRQMTWKHGDPLAQPGDCGVLYKEKKNRWCPAFCEYWYAYQNLACSGRRWFICQRNYNACRPNPCEHGGACREAEGDGYTCQCSNGYHGKNCEEEMTCAKPITRYTEITHVDGVPTSPVPGEFRLHQTITFSCTRRNMFIQDPSSTRTCLPDGEWDERAPDFCDYRPCEPNPCMNGGVCEEESERYTCRCRDGYNGANCDQEMTCAKPSTRNTEVTHVDGRPTSQVPFSFQRGQTISFSCNERYKIVAAASATLTCLASGIWDDQAPDLCETVCEIGDAPPHGHWDISNGVRTYSVDTEVRFSCDQGFQFYGSAPRVVCQYDRTWSAFGGYCADATACDPNPCRFGGRCRVVESGYECSCKDGFTGETCENGNSCQPPKLPDRAFIDDESEEFLAGTEVSLQCEAGRILHGGSSSLTCLGTGTWSQTDALCKADSCTLSIYLIPEGLQVLGFPDQGKVDKSYHNGADITLSCVSGATPALENEGDPVSRCQIGGRWSPGLYEFSCGE